MAWQKHSPLVQLEHDIFKCQHLLPQEIGANLHLPRVGDYWLIWNPSYNAPTHTMLMLSRQYQYSCSTLFMKWCTFLIFFVSWSKSVMLANCCFCISEKPMYWLALSNTFWDVWNTTLQRATGNHGNQTPISMWYEPPHALPMLIIDTPICAQVDFVRMVRVTIWPMWEVKFLLSGSKQLRPL